MYYRAYPCVPFIAELSWKVNCASVCIYWYMYIFQRFIYPNMRCTKLGWNCPSGSEEDFRSRHTMDFFKISLLSSLGRGVAIHIKMLGATVSWNLTIDSGEDFWKFYCLLRFSSHSRIFHTYGDVNFYRWGLQIFQPVGSIEQWGFFVCDVTRFSFIWSSLRTRDTHTCCRRFSNGAVFILVLTTKVCWGRDSNTQPSACDEDA